MKTLIAIALCLSIVTAQAQTTTTNAPPKGGGILEGMFALAIVSVGCYCVIYAYNKSADRDTVAGPAILILEKSELKGPWEAVWTNTIPACTTNKWLLFEERMGGAGCRYRVKEIPIK